MKKLKLNKKKTFLIVSIVAIAALVYFFFFRKKKIRVNYIEPSQIVRGGIAANQLTGISVASGIAKAITKGSLKFKHPAYQEGSYNVASYWINPNSQGDGGQIWINAPFQGTGAIDRQEAYIYI